MRTLTKSKAISDPFGGLFESLRLGDQIRAKAGHGPSRIGKIYGRVHDRFGKHLRIKFDDYTFDTCHGFVRVGIGFYYDGGRRA